MKSMSVNFGVKMAGTDRTLHNVLTNLPHILSKQFSNKILRKKIPFPSGKIQN